MRLPNIIFNLISKFNRSQIPYRRELPHEVDLGLTNHCNLHCNFCLNDKITKPRGFMQESLYRKIIDCVSNNFKNRTIVGLALFGEPLMHPKFIDFLDYARKKGTNIHISSNFLLMNKEKAKKIIKSNVSLVEISFYTMDKAKYNESVGVSVHDKVLENIHNFLKLADKSGFKGNIRLRPFENSAKEMSTYEKYFYSKYSNLNFVLKEPKIMRNWGGLLNIKFEGLWTRKPCSFPFRRMVVDWDGEVKLCCQAMLGDDLHVDYLGLENNLHKIWNGEKLNKIRKKFLHLNYSDFPSCQECYDSKLFFINR